MKYLIALIFAFAVVTTASAQHCPQQEGDAQMEQRGEQQDFGLEEDYDEMGTQPGIHEGDVRGEQRDYGMEGETRLGEDPETVYKSEDERLRIQETPEGNVIINYKEEGFTEDDDDMEGTGRVEGYGVEGEAQLDEEEFESVYKSEDERLNILENEDGEVMIKYKDEAAEEKDADKDKDFDHRN
ncbi:MAG: hypothetical protein ACK4ND_07215 [Cytophagaceae bacterium]